MGACIISQQRQRQLQNQLRAQNDSKTQMQTTIANFEAENVNLKTQISQLTKQEKQQLNQVDTLNQLKSDINGLRQKKAKLQNYINSASKIPSNVRPNPKSEQIIFQLTQKLQQLNMQCFCLQQNKGQGLKYENKPLYQLDKQIATLKAKENQLTMYIQLLKQNKFVIILEIEKRPPIQLTVEGSITIKQLKQIIYQHYDQLIPQLMNLLDNQGCANNVEQRIQHVFVDPIVNLKIKKGDICELDGFKTDKNIADDIFGQMGVAFMQCGHAFSRTAMRETIKVQINAKQQHYITCPYSKQGQNALCLHIFANQECRLIAGYVRDEWNQIQDKLAKNFSKKTTKQCPQCKNFITRSGVTTKKAQCPFSDCKTYFCIECGDKWKQGKNDCFSQACNGINQIIAKAPRDRVFKVTKRENNEQIDLAVPNLRACPSCRCLVMNTVNCKHTKCMCGKQFCFICLSVKNGGWSCGGPFQQCPLAPNQKFGQTK